MVGASSEAKTIRFSGYDWTVKSGDKEPPDSNNWDENNVDLTGDHTTHRFIWNSTSVSFQSLKDTMTTTLVSSNSGRTSQLTRRATIPEADARSAQPLALQRTATRERPVGR
jgi:hypothetical protein